MGYRGICRHTHTCNPASIALPFARKGYASSIYYWRESGKSYIAAPRRGGNQVEYPHKGMVLVNNLVTAPLWGCNTGDGAGKQPGYGPLVGPKHTPTAHLRRLRRAPPRCN